MLNGDDARSHLRPMMTASQPCFIIILIILLTIPLRPPVERTTLPLKRSFWNVCSLGGAAGWMYRWAIVVVEV